MQQWSKSQSQSRILYKIIFTVIFGMIVLFSFNSQAYGEPDEQIDISEYLVHENFKSGFGKVIETDKIILKIGENGNVRVTHIITGSIWGPNEPRLIQMFPGERSNPSLTDEDGDLLRPWGWTAETFEEAEYMIAGQKGFRAYDLHASYDLENYLELSDRGLWSKHLKFPHDVTVMFDDDIELVFANSRPIDVVDVKGVNCIGCDMYFEFFEKIDPIKKTLITTENKFEELSNIGEEFTVEFISDGEIGEINFIQELNYFSFNTNEDDQLYVIKIPLDLLLSPYHVYVTDFDQEILLEADKIRKTEFGQTDTHANLSFRPMTQGVVHIVGSDQMEHEKLVEKIKERTPEPEPQTNSNIESEEQEMTEIVQPDQLYANWENKSQSTENNMDNIIIFVIIGIVAAVIIGIVVKLKKN